jgi:hypothetical protein
VWIKEVADRLMIPFEDNYLLLGRLIFQRLVGARVASSLLRVAPSGPAPTDVSMLDALEKQHEEDKAVRKEAIKDSCKDFWRANV